jgi:hypothetical protein
VSGSNDYRLEIMHQCELASSLLDYNLSCGRFDGIGYVLHYNFTAVHGVLMLENIATTAMSRFGANNAQLNIHTKISPLPISRLEEDLIHGEHAMIAWLLVCACPLPTLCSS